MEISSELEKNIRTALSLFMDEPEAERFMDLDYATSLVKQRQLQQPPWQSLVSIGLYTVHIYAHPDKDVQKTLLQQLVGQALEPVDTLFQSILPKPGEKPLEGEQARLLFYTRFALGFLLLAQGDTEHSRMILHAMAATKVSIRGHSYYGEGPGVLNCSHDIQKGKSLTAMFLYAEYTRQKKPSEILYLMTEAIACDPMATSMLSLLPSILDSCVAECEKGYDGKPGLEWLWLFVEASELLSLYEYDTSGSRPNECKKESAQYLAWKIGQIAGRFAVRWPDDPFGEFRNFTDAVGAEECQSERGEEKTLQAIMAILALLREYDTAHDWQKMQDQCLLIWGLSDRYSGMPLSEIGPCHDLYWAMRIGIADTLSKHPEPLPGNNEMDVDTVSKKMWREIDDIVARESTKSQSLPREELLNLSKSEESTVLEFKSSSRWDYKENCLNDGLCLPVIKTVAAFLNGQGGRLLIGVSDDHEILGLRLDYKGFRKERDQYTQFIVNKLGDYIGKVEYSQYVSIGFHKFDDKDLCLLDVRPSLNPVYVREGNSKEFYIRIENETRRLNTKEAVDYIGATFPRRYSQT